MKIAMIKRNQFFFAVILAIIFCLIYLLNFNYPFFADDYPFSMIYGTNIRVNSLSDLVESQYLFYFNHSGRTVEHSIAQILIWINTPICDILHTIAYVLLLLIIYKISDNGYKSKLSLFCVIFLLNWFFQPSFSPTVLNITSGSVYMWGTLINLLFMYPYCRYYINKKNDQSKEKIIFFFLFGIIAGWTQENMAPSMIFFILILFFLLKKQERLPIPYWAISGLLGALIGCLFLIGAPGNYVRIISDPAATVAKANPLLNGFYNVVGGYLYNGILITVLYVIILIVYSYRSLSLNKILLLKLSILFFVTGLFALALMIFSPIFPPRAWFGIIIFFIVAIAILYNNLDLRNVILKYSISIILILGSVLFSIQYKNYLSDLIQINKVVSKREKIIHEQKEKNNYHITLHEVISPKTKFGISDPITDSTHWLYPIMVDYYGVKSIRFDNVK